MCHYIGINQILITPLVHNIATCQCFRVACRCLQGACQCHYDVISTSIMGQVIATIIEVIVAIRTLPIITTNKDLLPITQTTAESPKQNVRCLNG